MTTITIERELLEQALEVIVANTVGAEDIEDALQAALAAPATAPDERLKELEADGFVARHESEGGMTHAQPASRIVQRVTSCRDCPKSRYEGRNAYRCAAAHRNFDDEDLPEAIPDWCPLESEVQPERKPMNADAIYQLAQRSAANDGLTAIVRAVEAFHNIKDKP